MLNLKTCKNTLNSKTRVIIIAATILLVVTAFVCYLVIPRTGVNSMSEIIIYKDERELELIVDSNCIGLFKIGLSSEPSGTKDKEGDKRTPEGEYYICTRNERSRYTFFLGISYPNINDAQRNLDLGKIDQKTYNTIKSAIENKKQPPWNTPLGGEIGIHGGGCDSDWTLGCIAVSDEDIQLIKQYAPFKTPVKIYASRNSVF